MLLLLVVACVTVTSACSGGSESGNDGRSSVVVPRVVGMSAIDAVEKVYATGLCIQNVKQVSHGGENRVVAQTPSAGTHVSRLQGVSLTYGPAGLSADIVQFPVSQACPPPSDSSVVVTPPASR